MHDELQKNITNGNSKTKKNFKKGLNQHKKSKKVEQCIP
jgi:hypothetical protein